MCPSYVALHGFDGRGGRSGAANLPDEYRLVTLKTTAPRAEQPEVYATIDKYAETFKREFEPDAAQTKSLYLYSAEPGTGKTTTAAALLNEKLTVHYVGSVGRNRQPSDRPAYFLDVNEWQTDYNTFNRAKVPESMAEPAATRYYRALSISQTVPFLVMDDIGVRDASEAFRADLHAIVNARVSGRLPTIYTSNVPMTQLDRVFDRRLADRVRDQCAMLSFKGTSRRGMRKV